MSFQKARELTRQVYKTFKDLKDFGFKDQIQRAAVSVMSNIAEGFERGTQQELVNYLFIAKGSAGEVRAQLYVALDAEYLKSLAEDCSRLLQSFAEKVKTNNRRGTQFKNLPKPDPGLEILKKHAPAVYERLYGK
jgi:four helix bundle protein